jgi:hypothetical protein
MRVPPTNNPPELSIDAPEVTTLPAEITKPFATVDEDNVNVGTPDEDTLNCKGTPSTPSSNTICGLGFDVVPVGNIVTLLAIILILIQYIQVLYLCLQ